MVSDPRFDEAIHASTRLRLCAILRPVESVDFAALAAMLEVSDANLSKTIRNLAAIGYVRSTKRVSAGRGDARLTTSVRLTPVGRQALDGHLAALRALAESAAGMPTRH